MAKPTYDQRKEVLFSQAQVALLIKAASLHGLPLSTYIRVAAVREARRTLESAKGGK